MKATLIFLFAMFAYSTAHMCLLAPKQRGTANDLNSAGAADCGLMKPKCGDRPPDKPAAEGNPRMIYEPEEKAEFIFQKNLDHYNKNTTAPGYFEINITDPDMKKQMQLAKMDDSDTASGHLYTVEVTMPKDEMPHAIIMATYSTRNDNAPPFFYQCSDIAIRKGPKKNIDKAI